MPITVLNDPHASWAGAGYAAGQGLGSGLEQLVNIKLAEVLGKKQKEEQFKESSEFWDSIPGIDKQFAKGMARQPREFQMEALKNLGIVQGAEEQQQQFYDPQQGFRSQQQGQQNTPSQEAVNQTIQDFLQGRNNLNNLGYGDKLNPQQGMGNLNQMIQQQQMQRQYPLPNGERSDVAPMTPEVLAQQMQQQQQQANQQGRRIVAVGPRADAERRHQETLAQRERESQREDIKDRFKETKEFRESIYKAAQAAKQDLKALDRMQELEDTGKLDTPGYLEFLKNAGLDISALKNPESEEFQKISQGFMRNAKQFFGGKITDFEIRQFLETIPNLSQSPEGRKAVISGLKSMARGAIAYNETMQEVMDKNKGAPPRDIMEEVDKKVDKKLEKVAEQFKRDLTKKVPEAQNKLVTAAQSVAGKAVGATPKLLKGAAGAFTGAKLGARLGPIGAGIGGLVGGLGGLSGLV